MLMQRIAFLGVDVTERNWTGQVLRPAEVRLMHRLQAGQRCRLFHVIEDGPRLHIVMRCYFKQPRQKPSLHRLLWMLVKEAQ